MADIAAKRITNIVSVTQGSNVYKGIRSVDVIADKGTLAAIFQEGDIYPTGVELLGNGNFPVQTRMNFETDGEAVLALLAEGTASLVVVYKVAGGGANVTMTIANHFLMNETTPLAITPITGRFAVVAVAGAAYSSDGTSLPISFAD